MSHRKQVVLFQGDSITDGQRGRSNDLNHILGHSYAYIIASKLSCELAEQAPEFINKGISGNRVSDLYARWNEDAISIQPDLLSILIGVNDAGRSVNSDPSGVTDRFERAYRVLLEETREVLPQTTLILCEPFILKAGVVADRWDAWTERMTSYQQIVRKLAEEFETVFVPLQAAFDRACSRTDASYWIWDGVHPTPAGHHLIAMEWLSVAKEQRLIGENITQ